MTSEKDPRPQKRTRRTDPPAPEAPKTKQQFTVVRVKLGTVLTARGQRLALQQYVYDCNKALVEGHLLAALYVAQRCRDGLDVPKLDQSFFQRVLKEVCSGGKTVSADRFELAGPSEQYRQARHADYAPAHNSYLGNFFQTAAVQLTTNVKVSAFVGWVCLSALVESLKNFSRPAYNTDRHHFVCRTVQSRPSGAESYGLCRVGASATARTPAPLLIWHCRTPLKARMPSWQSCAT